MYWPNIVSKILLAQYFISFTQIHIHVYQFHFRLEKFVAYCRLPSSSPWIDSTNIFLILYSFSLFECAVRWSLSSFFIVPDYFPNISFYSKALYTKLAANCATNLFKIQIRWLFFRGKPQVNAFSFKWNSDSVGAFSSSFIFFFFFFSRYLTRSVSVPSLSSCFLNHLNKSVHFPFSQQSCKSLNEKDANIFLFFSFVQIMHFVKRQNRIKSVPHYYVSGRRET